MAERDHSWHHARAQKLLWDVGAPIASTEITLLVVRLLHGLEAGLDDDVNVEAAMATVADGPVGLVHSEPLLGTIAVDPPARTVAEAADRAVRTFGRTVLDRQRRDPVVPSPPPTPEQRDTMWARYEAERPARITAALEHLTSATWTERANAASVLGRYAVLEARPALEALLDDQYPEVARAASEALAALPLSAGSSSGLPSPGDPPSASPPSGDPPS